MQVIRHGERGQTLPESALFLPIAILLLMGIIYASQYTVVAARTQMAVRYGSNTTDGTALYSVANIYSGLTQAPTGGTCVPPPPTVLSDGAPLAGPTSPPFWQPSAVSTSCNAAYSKNQGAQFLSLFVASTVQTVTASPNIESSVSSFLQGQGVTVGGPTTATEAFARTADPGTILCSSSEVRNRVYAALDTATPSPAPSPAGSPTPLPVDAAC